ncbi:spartin a isoform X2 [Sphaeramia orbicularis]|uniref:Spartin n=2 Tax=Sphaeramia orbicularis TaxID=375764 RepID=A0A672YSV2_9TELE|nr:spartin isoform X2 [Sphaeramia orbicularis]XP_030010214.1 spartin isoform X2 [Sphaeramia orbicularis]XP_030010215.1 spartin isoform X2 [Sphaeramia orbicularis]XP_030010216.1 spartin isoform X2 [Sphaeramia orbicularis]XP_030010217.1 spartin isoform X2 [Sphaeramia orbicularis]XP_030010220.1 spartin isoform X2 [Sphaeramia orbicularis]
MAEPAELMLIKDQYESAFHSLSRGLAAEEAGKKEEALVYFKKGQGHLTHGLEVPTGGERQRGPVWDKARQLQQRMRDTLQKVNTHLTDLETPQLTTGSQRDRLLMHLTPDLYPNLASNSQPPNSSLHHLYPSIPATQQGATPAPKTAPPRPPCPGASKHRTAAAATSTSTAMANQGDQPPAYTPQPTDGHRSLGYGPAGGGLGLEKQTGQNGKELLFIPSGVQLFFVAPNGQVSSLFYPGFLRIIAFDNWEKNSSDERPSAFLHVCDWLYPLTPDTPVLLANSGIYMFPDTLTETPGSFVGIVLSSELPATDREMFQDLLVQLADLRVQAPEDAGSEVINLSKKVPLDSLREQTGSTAVTREKEKLLPGWSEKMADGILSGASWLSQEFVKGAEATSRAIHKSGFKIRDRVTPEETPSEVSPRVTKSLNAAKTATGGAVKVSQFLVNGVSTVAGHVAEKVAPHVKKHGAKLIPESMKKSKDGRASNLQGAKHVAVSSVHGFSTVWSSLETGAKLVGKSVSAETVTTVKYKYGEDAGDATDTAIKSLVNVGVTAYNIDNLGIKAILKTTGKQTAKELVKKPDGETEENEKTDPQTQTGTEAEDKKKKEEEEEKK